MKKITIVLLVLANSFAQAQEIKVDRSIKIWESKESYIKLDDDREESPKYWDFTLYFQNNKYSHITDIGSIIFSDTTALKLFVGTCDKMMYHQSSNLNVDGKGYRLIRHSSLKDYIFVYSKEGEYCLLTKEDIGELKEVVKNLNNYWIDLL